MLVIHILDVSFLSNWYQSQEKCRYHTTPDYLWDICKTLPDEHRNAWLPMHRVVFWTEVTCDGIATNESVTECESFRCYHTGEVPSFQTNIPCSKKADGFFCVFSSPYNMTTDNTKTVADSAKLCPGIYSYKSTNYHGSNERTINAKKTTGKRSFSTIINSPPMLQSTTNIVTKQDDKRHIRDIPKHHATSNIGLIVGGVLGTLAIIGVVILVLILKLRRTQALSKRQNNEQSEISNDNHERNTPSNNIRMNQLYEDEEAHAGRPVPVRTKGTEIATEPEGKKPNDVYAVVMKNNNPPPVHVGFKSVVASAEAVESEYDRLNITPKCLANNMENNLYDSSIAERCESDPTYNTATNIRHSRQHTEDVYN
ncbi:uncharacterized protein LOC143055376 [Mytilus galloprovincialis]|uniref:uncharacterized protein LOC143055376 n=1 Tax=Mytilus galloprovincialis TaxID=29158 RepID=UPI003F7B87D4